MRRAFLILALLLFSIPSAADDAKPADDAKAAVDKAIKNGAAADAIDELTQDPSQFEVTTKIAGDRTFFSRRGQVILIRSNPNNVYHLYGPGGVGFGIIRVGLPNSPYCMFEPDHHHVTVALQTLPGGSMQLEAIDLKASFEEVYIVTHDSVRPVSAKEYLHFHAEGEAARAFADSLRKSFQAATPTTKP